MTEGQSTPLATGAPAAPPAGKSRWKRWLLATVVVAAVLFVAFLIAVPIVLSSGFAKGWVLDAVREQVTSDVEVDDMSFSWGEGVTLSGVRVKNPAGFPPGDAVAIERVQAGLSFSRFLTGGIKVQARLVRPEITLVVKKGGRNNLEALQKRDVSVETSGGGKGGDKTDGEFGVWLKFEQTRGLVRIIDEERGIEQTLSGIEITCGNDGFGRPILMTLDGTLGASGAQGSGKVSVSARADLNRAMPLEFFRFDTTGIDLGAYAPIVASLMPEQQFETFRGRIKGNVSATPAESGGAVEFVGDLSIDDLEIRGGPLGPGKGIVAETWKLTPNARVSWDGGASSVTGTQLDLGFARVSALPAAEAKAVFGAAGPDRQPLGLLLDVDLAALAAQPIVPKGTWQGTARVRLGVVLPAGSDRAAIPFAADVQATGLVIQGDFLPEGAKIPETVRLRTNGSLQRGEKTVVDGTYELGSTGIDGSGKFRVADAYDASLQLAVDAAGAGPLIQPFLPAGMSLAGKADLSLTAKGSLAGADSNGGLLAGGMVVDGLLKAPALTYLGNTLAGLGQKIRMEQGRLTIEPSGGNLNGGPLALTARIEGLEGSERTVDFDLTWKNGKAGYGLTPVLQYAVPLLAGLPTNDVEKLAGIDFQSTAGISIKGKGPLPTGAEAILDVLAKWTAEGSLDLLNGSFSPSTALDAILKLLPGKSKLAFDDIRTGFKIEKGRVKTEGFRLGGKDGTITLTGSTALDGGLDVSIDFTDLLSKHRDGRRVLGLLKDKPLTLGMAGTLWSPEIKVEDFAKNILQQGLQNAVGDFLKGLGSGKKPKNALEDLLKGLGGKKK